MTRGEARSDATRDLHGPVVPSQGSQTYKGHYVDLPRSLMIPANSSCICCLGPPSLPM